MDGENTTMTHEHIYARSPDSGSHPSRNWVKGLWGSIRHEIPPDWRSCGENLFARHSVPYNNLPSYFMVYSIWDENNQCINIDETIEFCKLLGLEFVPTLHRGIFDLDFIKNFQIDKDRQEGFVMRLTKSFRFEDFNKSVVKWVRKGHVKSEIHWMQQTLVPNGLRKID